MVKNTEQKKQIRTKILKLRSGYPSDEKSVSDRMITERILESTFYQEARCVYSYVSVGNEADTLSLIRTALHDGKRVAAPRVRGKHRMEFYFIKSLADLVSGFHGIPEPGPWCPKAPYPGKDVLMCIPGTAFDRSGRRIGYGGGYYDTYLEKCHECRRTALAYSFQIVEEIPAESHDMDMQYIFTEKELIICRQDYQEIR